MRTFPFATLVLVSLAGTARAGTITPVGAVKALDNVAQLQGIVGTGDFDEGPTNGGVPLNVYSLKGLTWRTGPLSSILPGVTNSGSAWQPEYATWAPTYFPVPIAGGGTHTGNSNMFAGVATFTVSITQVGLTASENGEQYLTAWDKQGVMLGQVTWTPAGDSAFVGIDTLGVPIGMIAYGNHDVWAGQPYDIGGSTIISDSWVWAQGTNACDDGNPCTDDSGDLGGNCTHTPSSGAACDDGNGCTTGDHCVSGACVGGPPLVCKPLDLCHDVGVCNPINGTCSDPPKPDGTACNDQDACSPTSTCQAGVCTGQNPVVCPPPDQCHAAGTCDMTTGICDNPAKADGTPCDDGNACTQADTCQAGVCTAGQPVTCDAPDGCHDVGTCDTTTGKCSSPIKPDGSLCDDGNACTPGDTCKAGVCSGGAPDPCMPTTCHEAGTCDPMTGICGGAPLPDGTACLEGACKAGACVTGTGGSTPAPDTSSGCHCGVVDPASNAPPAAALLALLALGLRRRRSR